MPQTYSLCGWEKYQHYGKRESVPWVKLHRDTLTSVAWIGADDLARTLMVGSMMLAARYQNAIPLDWKVLRAVLALRCSEKQFRQALSYLADSGFLEICEHDASKKLEQEEKSRADKRKNPPSSPQGGKYPQEFLALWDEYPSRGNHPDPQKPAFEAFERAIENGAQWEDIVEGARRFASDAASIGKVGTEFIPQLRTWLEEGRWKDQPKTVPEPQAVDPTTVWRDRVRVWASAAQEPDRRFWPEAWGPKPHRGNPNIPPAVVSEFNLDGLTPPSHLRRVS